MKLLMRPAPSPPWRIDRTLPWAVVALAFVLGGFELTDIDLCVQDLLFDSVRGAWRIDSRDPLWRALIYTGPKVALIGFGVAVLGGAFATSRLRRQLGISGLARRDLLVLALTLATVPTLVGGLKARTNVFCPSELQRYGGDVCYLKPFEKYSPGSRPVRRGRGFPAGHASGGFALVALAGVATTRRAQRQSLALASAIGSAMGFYQMAKGAHFLSHTLVTALLAWIVFLGWRRLLHVVPIPFLSTP